MVKTRRYKRAEQLCGKYSRIKQNSDSSDLELTTHQTTSSSDDEILNRGRRKISKKNKLTIDDSTSDSDENYPSTKNNNNNNNYPEKRKIYDPEIDKIENFKVDSTQNNTTLTIESSTTDEDKLTSDDSNGGILNMEAHEKRKKVNGKRKRSPRAKQNVSYISSSSSSSSDDEITDPVEKRRKRMQQQIKNVLDSEESSENNNSSDNSSDQSSSSINQNNIDQILQSNSSDDNFIDDDTISDQEQNQDLSLASIGYQEILNSIRRDDKITIQDFGNLIKLFIKDITHNNGIGSYLAKIQRPKHFENHKEENDLLRKVKSLVNDSLTRIKSAVWTSNIVYCLENFPNMTEDDNHGKSNRKRREDDRCWGCRRSFKEDYHVKDFVFSGNNYCKKSYRSADRESYEVESGESDESSDSDSEHPKKISLGTFCTYRISLYHRLFHYIYKEIYLELEKISSKNHQLKKLDKGRKKAKFMTKFLNNEKRKDWFCKFRKLLQEGHGVDEELKKMSSGYHY